MNIPIRNILAIAAGLSLAGCSAAEDTEKRIAHARSAAPASISADATIVIDGQVVVKGTNGWACMPDTMENDGAPMCNDSMWMKMMNAVAP